MTAPIVQLVCLLVVLAFSYGEEVNASNPVVKFYCEADHIKNISTKLGRSGINVTLPDCCACSLNSASVKAVMDHFSKTCKTFTAINAFKYQLQHYLFHDWNSATLPAEYVVQQLTSLITGLQTAAKYLQEVAVNEGTVCVKFTPKHYVELYECGLLYANNEPIRTSEAVLASLFNNALKIWVSGDGFYDTITNAVSLIPSDCW